MSKFNSPKNEKKWNVHKIGDAHLQCVNNNYAKFEYKGHKLMELHIKQTRQHLSMPDGENA